MLYELKINTDTDSDNRKDKHKDRKTGSGKEIVRLRLLDEEGRQLAQNALDLSEHGESYWYGLFDTRRYVALYKGNMQFADSAGAESAGPATASFLLDRLGVFLGEVVLGGEIMAELLATSRRRTLLVRLPTTDQYPLAAAFARVPWEIAKAGPGEGPLMDREGIKSSFDSC